MKYGDFSRIRLLKKLEQEKNFRKVLWQQGRVLTDADWNDLVLMDDQQNIKSLRDIIGKNGVPLEQENSFKIIPKEDKTNRYTIGKGRIYVDGILVENFSDVEAFSVDRNVIAQPYLPSPLINGQPVSDAVPTEPGIYLAYIKVMDGHITYIEDSNIQESALGDSDTSTRLQTRWQVLLHRLEDREVPKEFSNEESRWAPWISLESTSQDVSQRNISIGANNDGSLLEVFVEVDPFNIFSKRQLSLDPVKWEDNWIKVVQGGIFLDFDITSKHVNNLEIMYGLGRTFFNNPRQFFYFTRDDDDERQWHEEKSPPNQGLTNIIDIQLISNVEKNIQAFGIGYTLNGQFQKDFIYYNRQINSNWQEWIPIDRTRRISEFSVILNPNNKCIEIYAFPLEDKSSILYTKQKTPNGTEWTAWQEINAEDPRRFENINVGVNSRNQIIIFTLESQELWYTILTETDPLGNGWNLVGGDTQPAPFNGSICFENNPKKNRRLEVIGLFQTIPGPGDFVFSSVWNITEDENGEWKSKWKMINNEIPIIRIASSIDKMSRVNIFALEHEKGSILHSYIEDTKQISCQSVIPSWESKIKTSTLQMKARARPQKNLPDDPCLLPEQAGYRRLENQLYRIEIHESKIASKNATFKYSRDNAIVSSRILNISGEKITRITVASLGRDRLLRFKIGEWIEITDKLRDLRGMPGVLARINAIEGTDLIFDNSKLIPSDAKIDNDTFPQQFNPRAIRWDSPGVLDVKIPTENNGWIEIEDGIEVKFNNINSCKTADYFTIPARTSKADIEWPNGINGLPEFVDIEGIEYHYAKLALLEYTIDGGLKVISDCRDFFPPLNTLDKLVTPTLAPSQEPESQSVICWIHGTISEVEFPELLEKSTLPSIIGHGIKHGTGSTYSQRHRQNFSFNWFHFPISISYPVKPDTKITLQKIYILFDSNSRAKILQVDIYDGGLKKAGFAPLDLSGDHGKSPDESTTFSVSEEIVINSGIGISIKVSFTGTEQRPGIIDFRSVGVQLKID
jgi:hypothetical protein